MTAVDDPVAAPAPGQDPFGRGGTVGEALRRVDWGATPLGPVEGWSRGLLTAVRIVLSSRFSMWMAWGPELTFFCNDAYRRDTLGTKFPWALGRPASEVWAEIWPDLTDRVEAVTVRGEATWDEGLQLFLVRNGYVEETYHTFSYSPLNDDDGSLSGLLCVVSEDTERVISARRLDALRSLGTDLAAVQSEPDVLSTTERALSGQLLELPFCLLYLVGPDGGLVRAAASGIPVDHPAAPLRLDPDGPWPVSPLATGGVAHVEQLARRFPDLPTGGWDEPPDRAVVLPLQQHADAAPFGLLVAAVNRYRPLDIGYQGFLGLVAGQLSAALSAARSYDAERDRAEHLAELDRAKTAFFTNVSHEFRTPLTLLLGPAEDALRDETSPLPEVQRQRLEVVSRNALRLLKLVNALLEFSRLEAGQAEGRFTPLDLAAVTADLARTFQDAADRAGLTLTIDCPPLPAPVWVDEQMWSTIVLNLLSNALKFTFDGGITVALRGSDEGVALEVSDTGVGIDEQDREHLFERFHRAEGVRSRTHEGSGIGLALVAELAEVHGGTAEVRSTPGVGSTFAVRLPWGRDEAPAAPRAASLHQAESYLAEAERWLEPVAAPSLNQDGRPRVLVVDDNADMRDYIGQLLAPQYDVVTADDGLVALELARSEAPDLVLTDVMLPGLDGFGLLAALRQDPATSQLPVVMLSARAGQDSTVEGLEAGADDYLVKPFAARELLARVRANLELDRVRRARLELERSRGLLDQAQRLAQVSSWEVDLATGKVSGSEEFFRQLQLSAEELESMDLGTVVGSRVHPDDAERVTAILTRALAGGAFDYEVRMVLPQAGERIYRTIGEVVLDELGAPALLRGSNQDITSAREVDRELAEAAAAREAAAREFRIADELQGSLLPPRSFDPDHLDIATYYRAGVEGTQVGGDWYDVIELGAGRTALVLGDVMGRGVKAASVMGQLRSTVRAYARLDLPPADVLENLDAAVRELGTDQIVTCVYAVYDPGERSLTYANAGHLPPLLCAPGQPVRRLLGSDSPPLGIARMGIAEERVELPASSLIALYTDGLVEQRSRDIDDGIDALAAALEAELADLDGPLEDLPRRLVDLVVPGEPDDDIAVLLARLDPSASLESMLTVPVDGDVAQIRPIRHRVETTLLDWGTEPDLVDSVVLLVSELVTNAILHGKPPVELRVRRSSRHLVLEVQDHATYLPRRMRPGPDDEHGRGLQLAALLGSRWGTRPTHDGKVVWCIFGAARRGA